MEEEHVFILFPQTPTHNWTQWVGGLQFYVISALFQPHSDELIQHIELGSLIQCLYHVLDDRMDIWKLYIILTIKLTG